jgi:hypothetical protein
MKATGVIFCLLMLSVPLLAKKRKDIPPAPLPGVVINAKKIFLANGGGSNLAYDSFYSEMKNWGEI